jgi:hypothetical protein
MILTLTHKIYFSFFSNRYYPHLRNTKDQDTYRVQDQEALLLDCHP